MDEDRRNITFAQAEGKEPLPQPLALEELSQEARAGLWAIVYSSLKESIDNSDYGLYIRKKPWGAILTEEHVLRLYLPIDEYTSDPDPHIKRLKALFFEGECWQVLDWIQWLLRSRNAPYQLDQGIGKALKHTRVAYQLGDNGRTIYPAATAEEGTAIAEAFAATSGAGLSGAHEHLRQASDELNNGNYDDSCRESIHSVESVARLIDPKASKDLRIALRKLEDKKAVHPALRKAFVDLYGYTNDEKGIRHSQLNDSSNVTQHEAVFLLGACASFVTYLINRGRESGLIP